MKCPLMNRVQYTKGLEIGYEVADCLKEKCAWWDNTNGMCAVLQLSKSVYFAGLHIAQAELRMPHVEQFKK